MKKNPRNLFTSLLFCIWSSASYAQVTTIERIQEGFLKINQSNYLKVTAEGIPCDSLFLKSEADVEKYDACTWIIRPKFYENLVVGFHGTQVKIFQLRNSDTILLESRYYRLEKLKPLVTTMGAKLNGDTISKQELVTQRGVSAYEAFGQYGCVGTTPDYFKCLILRGEELIFFADNKTGVLSAKIIKAFTKTKSGDEVILFDFSFGEADQLYERASTLRYFIK